MIYSVVFTQMTPVLVEQGKAMKTTIVNFRIPVASTSAIDILSVALVIFPKHRVLDHLSIGATLRMSKVDIHAAGILKFTFVVFMASPCSTKSDVICGKTTEEKLPLAVITLLLVAKLLKYHHSCSNLEPAT
ncbi:hypothetical protein RDI58_018810 [Solanum bulbocastanum]|uniref:Uncharacterized protein n=1 Tax=Solanum bulbocastanum TaxID=147425 RepID=A0AAN8TDV8_SOLBU